MPRRSRNPGVLAGWLFADLALVLAFVFLDSNASGGAGPVGPPSSTTTTIVSTTTTTEPGVDPKPINVVVGIKLDRNNPSKLDISWDTFRVALENAITNSKSENKEAKKFLVVMVRVGSEGTDRKFAGPLGQDLAELLKTNWEKVQSGVTYYDTGDDASLDVGLVRLKLFPVLG